MYRRRRFSYFALAIAMAAVFTAVGCSSGKAPVTPAPAGQGSTDPAAAGAQKMRALVPQFQQALESQDSAKAREVAGELDKTWEQFEDGVKARDKVKYGQIEDALGIIKAGSESVPLDVKTLGDQARTLDGLLAGFAK